MIFLHMKACSSFNISSLLFRFTLLVLPFFLSAITVHSKKRVDYTLLPKEIKSGPQGKFHVQGIAFDYSRNCIYMSFTTELLKLDFNGNLLASVKGITGHLGCLALHPKSRNLYASLEYKHDVIGSGIQKELGGVQNDKQSAFYVAIFDTEKMDRIGMDASEVMTTIYIKEAVDDYMAKVQQEDRVVEHRYGCSGIDGLAFAPKVGKKRGLYYLYVAYGIYSDEERSDNDYQVLLCFDVRKWKRISLPLQSNSLHKSGPIEPNAKFFVRTGNTTWGIQNLTYDSHNRALLAAVYAGHKKEWPNYTLFAIDMASTAKYQKLVGVTPLTMAEVLPLKPIGDYHEQTGIRGWNFPNGATGLCSLGKGYYYISHNAREKESLRESSAAVLYKWNGNEPFERVE